MHSNSRSSRGLKLALALIVASLAGCSAPRPDIAQLQGGTLDFRSRDFFKGEIVPLTGLWHFFPATLDIGLDEIERARPVLRGVPDLWKGDEAGGQRGHGYGTYHLTVLLPPKTPPLALHFLSASTAFRIEVQGKIVAQVGVPSSDPHEAQAAYRPGFVRLEPAGDRMDIVVRVSNYVYRAGGLWFPIFLGPADRIESIHLTELVVTIVQSTALAVMGLVLLLLFILRRKDRAYVFAGLVAILLSLRLLVTGDYVITSLLPWLPFDIMIRMEYFTVFFAFFVAAEFFLSLFPRLMARPLALACVVPPLAFTSLIFVLPLDLLTRTITYFYVYAFLYIVAFAVSLFLKTVLKKDPEGITLFVGAFIMGLSVVNDVFYSSFVWWTGNLAPWGFSVFVGFLVVIMVGRMTRAFAEVEDLLVQKELLMKEIHHRVKNSLQVVASLVSLQSNRVEDPAIREVFSDLRLRIVSMSLVHEKLYGKVASDSLDLGNYLQDLIRLLVFKDKIEEGKVNLTIETESIKVNPDCCFDAGLIVTELVSNSMKHGLLPKGGGELKVSLTRGRDSARITVEDDGPGFPRDFDVETTNSLGYKLIASLLKKHRGSFEIAPGPGGKVIVELGSTD